MLLHRPCAMVCVPGGTWRSVTMRRGFRIAALVAAAVATACLAQHARAQSAAPAPPGAKPEMRENCPGFIASRAPRVVPAALRLAELATGEVLLSYVGHATFLIESPQGVRVATDYNDYVRPRVLPDIVT